MRPGSDGSDIGSPKRAKPTAYVLSPSYWNGGQRGPSRSEKARPVTRELGLNLTGWIGIDAPGGGGMHTRGRLTVFEAFCGFRDGNPSKSNQRAKIHNPSGQDSRGGSLRRMGTAALAPALFRLARSHCVGSPRSLIVGEASPEPGHWPALERLRLQNDDFPEENTNRRETFVTRHRSPKCGHAHFADDGVSMGQLLDSTVGKTRDSFGPIRSLPHLLGIVTRKWKP